MRLPRGPLRTFATRLGPGAARVRRSPLGLRTAPGARPARGGQKRGFLRGGGAGATASCPEKPSPSRLRAANARSPLTKILRHSWSAAGSRRGGWPGGAGPAAVPVLRRAHCVPGARERVLCSGKASSRKTLPCSRRERRKALETGDSQGSDAVWFATSF